MNRLAWHGAVYPITRKTKAHGNHYHVIIIGSSAGGTLAHKLAPTGKKILVLARGSYVLREKEK